MSKALSRWKTLGFCLVAVLCLTIVQEPVLGETFYVAPDGDDNNPGTIAEPLATLVGARDRVRKVLDGSGDITVYLRGGTYHLSKTVVFGLEDSGSENQKITYGAYKGEKPVFTSGSRVTGWLLVEAGGGGECCGGGLATVRLTGRDPSAIVGGLDRFEPARLVIGTLRRIGRRRERDVDRDPIEQTGDDFGFSTIATNQPMRPEFVNSANDGSALTNGTDSVIKKTNDSDTKSDEITNRGGYYWRIHALANVSTASTVADQCTFWME